jgi:hypothetical protein
MPEGPRWARGFVGIVFRVSDGASKYEGIHLRPLNAVVDAQVARNRTVQYFSYLDHPWGNGPGVDYLTIGDRCFP